MHLVVLSIFHKLLSTYIILGLHSFVSKIGPKLQSETNNEKIIFPTDKTKTIFKISSKSYIWVVVFVGIVALMKKNVVKVKSNHAVKRCDES